LIRNREARNDGFELLAGLGVADEIDHRLAPPWKVGQQDANCIVKDSASRNPASVYFEDEPGPAVQGWDLRSPRASGQDYLPPTNVCEPRDFSFGDVCVASVVITPTAAQTA
jgi:hypothetical protein